MKTGAQEHFYMETQATLAIPREDKEMELFGEFLILPRAKSSIRNLSPHLMIKLNIL